MGKRIGKEGKTLLELVQALVDHLLYLVDGGGHERGIVLLFEREGGYEPALLLTHVEKIGVLDPSRVSCMGKTIFEVFRNAVLAEVSDLARHQAGRVEKLHSRLLIEHEIAPVEKPGADEARKQEGERKVRKEKPAEHRPGNQTAQNRPNHSHLPWKPLRSSTSDRIIRDPRPSF